ncbi:MAG: ion transporter [Melioribacteraceae bacterium]|nr:ion transporter [Melioribacteraceae bacterium]
MNKTSRERLHEIIFEADTKFGKLFDLGLITSILLSVAAVVLDSIEEINNVYGRELYLIEWFFTIMFTFEYLLRIYSLRRPLEFMVSFYGIIDLTAVLPTYLSLFVPGTQYLLVIRILRVLRVFRILKIVRYISEASMLKQALKASKRKIVIFLFFVLASVVILGSMMYLIEGRENGFTSIPVSIYWSIVTLTTVGYGDISPQTPLGQILASVIMILGYGIIAVPTGIVTSEMTNIRRGTNTQSCPSCGKEGHDDDADHCKYCGAEL